MLEERAVARDEDANQCLSSNCVTVLIFQPVGLHAPLAGWLCTTAGALNWWSVWAQWLWTVPYAAAVWQCFVAARRAGHAVEMYTLHLRHELA